MPFVKLDCGMLDSSLWVEPVQRELFITSLLMAEPFITDVSLPEIAPHSLDYTGWFVPPGWYGFVAAAGPGIIRRALVADMEAGKIALTALAAPDPASRSQDFEGRRMVRIQGGYIILNFDKYRTRDYTNAERQARFRMRKQQERNAVTLTSNAVKVTQAEAEADIEKKEDKSKRRASALPPDFEMTESMSAFAHIRNLDPLETFEAFKDYWLGNGKPKKDWMRVWQTWCRRQPEFKLPAQPRSKLSAVERVRLANPLPEDFADPRDYERARDIAKKNRPFTTTTGDTYDRR